jgi:hypothetical protein
MPIFDQHSGNCACAMAMSRCMKNSPTFAAEDSARTAEKLRGVDVELSDAPDFDPLPRKISLAAALALNEALLPWVNSRPGEMERRRRNKVPALFEL